MAECIEVGLAVDAKHIFFSFLSKLPSDLWKTLTFLMFLSHFPLSLCLLKRLNGQVTAS